MIKIPRNDNPPRQDEFYAQKLPGYEWIGKWRSRCGFDVEITTVFTRAVKNNVYEQPLFIGGFITNGNINIFSLWKITGDHYCQTEFDLMKRKLK